MPWNLLFGVTYNIDPIGAVQTKVVEKVYERQVAAPVPVARPHGSSCRQPARSWAW